MNKKVIAIIGLILVELTTIVGCSKIVMINNKTDVSDVNLMNIAENVTDIMNTTCKLVDLQSSNLASNSTVKQEENDTSEEVETQIETASDENTDNEISSTIRVASNAEVRINANTTERQTTTRTNTTEKTSVQVETVKATPVATPVQTVEPVKEIKTESTQAATKTPEPAKTSEPTATPQAVTANGLTESQVYSRMVAYKSQYPNGTHWTNEDNSYYWKGGIYAYGKGCAAFAFMLSDAAFGSTPARKTTDTSNVKVGDILRVNNDTHVVIVLQVKANSYVVAEGNYNSSVLWGREIPKTGINYVITRW